MNELLMSSSYFKMHQVDGYKYTHTHTHTYIYIWPYSGRFKESYMHGVRQQLTNTYQLDADLK
jgi:hypothetical protein